MPAQVAAEDERKTEDLPEVQEPLLGQAEEEEMILSIRERILWATLVFIAVSAYFVSNNPIVRWAWENGSLVFEDGTIWIVLPQIRF